jgi:predicted GIY-YIG superfamily endonuclease
VRRKKSSKPFPSKLFKEAYSEKSLGYWWVYVIQSQGIPPGKKVGFTYVGATNNPVRRLRQHNNLLPGGARFTSRWRPWIPRALYGPYKYKKQALKAEYALKHGKRGEGRCHWSCLDSSWCRGEGCDHPWVKNPTDLSVFDSVDIL